MKDNEFYFTTYATENEHYCIESDLRQGCALFKLELMYYRSFKLGHVPMYRECKIKGPQYKILQMLKSVNVDPDNDNKKVRVNGNKVPMWAIQKS